MKLLVYFYQRAFWYSGFAIAELLKPLRLWNETLLIITYFAVLGIRPTFWQIVLVYVGVMGVTVLGGKLLVLTDIVRYNTMLGNSQNSELSEILDRVRKIEKKIENGIS